MNVNIGKVQFSVYTEDEVKAMTDRVLVTYGLNAPDELTKELAHRLGVARSSYKVVNGVAEIDQTKAPPAHRIVSADALDWASKALDAQLKAGAYKGLFLDDVCRPGDALDEIRTALK